MTLKRLMAALIWGAASATAANTLAAVDPAIKAYTRTSGVSDRKSVV